MRKLFFFLALTVGLLIKNKQFATSPPPCYPFSLSGHYLNVTDADVNNSDLQRFRYSEWDMAFCYTHLLSNFWGLIFGAGVVASDVDLKDNPEFHQTFFSYTNLSFGSFTKIVPRWTWTLSVSLFFDNDLYSLLDSTLYQGVLHGKYDISEYLDFNLGVITEWGLKKGRAWPILGFSYRPLARWRLFLIYPIKIECEYDIWDKLKIAASIRFLRTRHRLRQTEPDSQGIFEYRSNGVEFALSYSPFRWFFVRGYLGSTFRGKLRVGDRNFRHISLFKFDEAFYSGFSAILSY